MSHCPSKELHLRRSRGTLKSPSNIEQWVDGIIYGVFKERFTRKSRYHNLLLGWVEMLMDASTLKRVDISRVFLSKRFRRKYKSQDVLPSNVVVK